MRFGEAIFAKAFDLLKYTFREVAVVSTLEHAVDQLLFELLEPAAATPSGHRATQPIRFAGAEAGGDHRELDDLFLKDRYAERAFEHLANGIVRICDWFKSLPAPQVGMNHVALDRSGSNDRDLDHEIVEARGFEPRQHRHLRTRFHLEHADAVATLQHQVGVRVFGRNGFDAERRFIGSEGVGGPE